MAAPIGPIRDIPQISPSEPAGSQRGNTKSADFGAALNNAISEVEASRSNANDKIQQLLGGKPEELHSVILSAQRAQLEFELFLEVRNKVVEAYQEVMRMQV